MKAVQNLCLGLFVPEIGPRGQKCPRFQNAQKRIQQTNALGSNGKVSQMCFEQKLNDITQDVRYQSVVLIEMNRLQSNLKKPCTLLVLTLNLTDIIRNFVQELIRPLADELWINLEAQEISMYDYLQEKVPSINDV